MLKVRAEKLGDVTVLQLRGLVIGAAIETLSEVVRAQTGSCAWCWIWRKSI
jgi:hypothetical protein